MAGYVAVAAAALIISVLALVTSIAGLVYVRLQGVETARLRKIESARWHRELTPSLSGEVEAVSGGAWHRLWLTVLSAYPLDRLEVGLAEGDGVFFTTGQVGVAPMTARPLEAVYDLAEPLVQGHRYAWRIEFDSATAPDSTRLKVRCYGRDEQGQAVHWDVLVQIGLPIDVSRTLG